MPAQKERLVLIMKKTYKIEVDCANCANLMEDAARKTAGEKCARCWHYESDVGSVEGYADLCPRCVSNLFGNGELRAKA